MLRSLRVFCILLIVVVDYSQPNNDTDESKNVNLSKDNFATISFLNVYPVIVVLITAAIIVACYCACCCFISICECANFAMTSLGKSVNLQADQVTMDIGEYSLNLAMVLTDDDRKHTVESLSANSTSESKLKSESIHNHKDTPLPDEIGKYRSSEIAVSMTPQPSRKLDAWNSTSVSDKRTSFQSLSFSKKSPKSRDLQNLPDARTSGSSLLSSIDLLTPPYTNSEENLPSIINVFQREAPTAVRGETVIASLQPISPMTAESISQTTISIPSTLCSPKSALSMTHSEVS